MDKGLADSCEIGARPGVDVCAPKDLSAELLAPGGVAGRLTVFTEAALKALEANE